MNFLSKFANYSSLSYPDGNYRGEINDKKEKNGMGKMVYKDGSIYEGQWK